MTPPLSLRSARLSFALFVALMLAGCGQWQLMKCVNDIVNKNAPYYSDADRDDSEQLARQTCRERAESKGN